MGAGFKFFNFNVTMAEVGRTVFNRETLLFEFLKSQVCNDLSGANYKNK